LQFGFHDSIVVHVKLAAHQTGFIVLLVFNWSLTSTHPGHPPWAGAAITGMVSATAGEETELCIIMGLVTRTTGIPVLLVKNAS